MTTHKMFVVAAGLALSLTACDNSHITDLNTNPNSPEDVPSSTLFTYATQQSVSRWLGGGYSLRATEFVVQHLAEVQYPDEDRYARLTGGSTTGYFDGPLVTELEDYAKIISKSTGAANAGTWAPAEIMRIWGFAYMTNTWGDIPYSEALKGDSLGGSLAPVYDAQKDIYTDMFARLAAASTALGAATNTLGTADPIYNGDPLQWRRFANSLRARLALTLINKDPATASTQLTAALNAAGGIITSNGDNAQLDWPGDGLYNNPWSDNFKGRDDHRLSRTLVGVMLNTSDPRIAVFAQPAPSDTAATPSITKYCTGGATCYVGLQNGMTQATAGPYVPYTSRPGEVFYPGATVYGFFGGGGASFPSYLFTAAEGNFILAEAAERGLAGRTPAQAKAFYDAGIVASMNQWGVDDDVVQAAFVGGTGVAYAGGVNGQIQIAIQKWVALFTDGGTAWTEWRRTCQPASIKPGPAAITSIVPRRFQYSSTEYSVNRVNLSAANARQGEDEFETRMYWDVPNAAPTFTAGCG